MQHLFRLAVAILTPVLVIILGRLAELFGSALPGLVSLALRAPAPDALFHALAVPPVMALAALCGRLVARLRLPFAAAALGLTLFALLPLLALADGKPLRLLLLAASAEALVAIAFAYPLASAAGLLATRPAKLAYLAVACALLPPVWRWETATPEAALLAGIPIGAPGAPIVPVKQTFIPPEDRPAFAAALAEAIRDGRIARDPATEALRNDVLESVQSLRAAPCNAESRIRARAAVLRFIGDLPRRFDTRDAEVFTFGRYSQQVTGRLNGPAVAALLEVLRAEVVTRRDLPAWAAQQERLTGPEAVPDPTSPLRCR